MKESGWMEITWNWFFTNTKGEKREGVWNNAKIIKWA